MDFSSMLSGMGGGGTGETGGGGGGGGSGMFSQEDSDYSQGGDAVTVDTGDVTVGGGGLWMGSIPGQQNTTVLIIAGAALLALLLWRKL